MHECFNKNPLPLVTMKQKTDKQYCPGCYSFHKAIRVQGLEVEIGAQMLIVLFESLVDALFPKNWRI